MKNITTPLAGPRLSGRSALATVLATALLLVATSQSLAREAPEPPARELVYSCLSSAGERSYSQSPCKHADKRLPLKDVWINAAPGSAPVPAPAPRTRTVSAHEPS